MSVWEENSPSLVIATNLKGKNNQWSIDLKNNEHTEDRFEENSWRYEQINHDRCSLLFFLLEKIRGKENDVGSFNRV